MIAWCMYYYMPWSDTLRAPQHNSNTCSTFFAFQYLDIRVKYGTWNTHPTNQLQVHLNIPLHATLTTLSYARDMTFKCEHTIGMFVPAVPPKISITSNIWTHACSIKYRLIIKLIAQLATNLRDESFKHN